MITCWCCLQFAFLVVVLALLRFIFQPYFVWKKEKLTKGGVKETSVHFKGKLYEFVEFTKAFKDQKYDLSIVVPSYNEEKRLPRMLTQTIKYLEQVKKYTYEIIVVSDASKDKTVDVALQFATFEGKEIDLKVAYYKINKGKGGAVRVGMMLAKGVYILMADADGATDINDFQKIWDNMKEIDKSGVGIVAGSRNHLVKDVVKERKWYRNILMHISNFIVNVICGVPMKDTQCGFKLFTNTTAKLLFTVLHLERWAFDVELFMIAIKNKMPFREIPVNWKDVEGSKLNVVEASITMSRDFVLVRLLYLLKLWRFDDNIVGKLD